MAPDPIPEEELPPRLRFERMVRGPEPRVFESVRPDPGADPPPTADEDDASVPERFEALQRSLSREIEPASPAPAPPPAPASPEPAVETSPVAPVDDTRWVESPGGEADSPPPDSSLDALQARIREVKRRERERSAPLPPPSDGDAGEPGDELPYEAAAPELTRKEKRRRRRKQRSFWQELPILVLVALVVAVIIKTFFFQAFYIPSGSMIPTLEINDRVLVNKLSYRFGAIERGDILVFDSPEAIHIDRSFVQRVLRSIGEATGITSPETVLIKRVIGLPGESVKVQDNQVYVNGNPIAEPYLPEGTTMRDFDEVVVPADHVFMMGDNRNQSRDSRVFGPIPREDIVGRAFVKVWPPGAWSGL